jgi:hypothetical protein
MNNTLKEFCYPFRFMLHYHLFFCLLSIIASQNASIDDMKHHIISWARTNVETDEIIRRLRDEWGIQTSRATVFRRLEEWGITRRLQTEDTPLLRASIVILFRLNCTDAEILIELIDYGYKISLTGLKRVRIEMGLRRRMSVFDRQARDAQLFEILKAELDEGYLEGYGRRHLYTYFKKRRQLVTRYLFFVIFLLFLFLILSTFVFRKLTIYLYIERHYFRCLCS